jgi:hypothetical protein
MKFQFSGSTDAKTLKGPVLEQRRELQPLIEFGSSRRDRVGTTDAL